MMGDKAAAIVRATMKFSFQRLSCLLLTHAIRFKPQAITVAMSLYGSKAAMYHGSMLIAGTVLPVAAAAYIFCIALRAMFFL